jgi:predicted CXXCH cytochrome family protein
MPLQYNAKQTRPVGGRRKFWLIGLAGTLAIVALFLMALSWRRSLRLPEGRVATYVGRQACVDCHRDQAKAFTNSHHDQAMAPADAQTVLADFSDVAVEDHGVPARFFRRNDQYLVHTEGPDGMMADFQVKYVFGVEPLQQYMVEIDDGPRVQSGDIGRVQVLRWSWDTEKKAWFHLDPPDTTDRLKPDDPLHWTGSAQRWNLMCAECHSTALEKNFDLKSLRYHTRFNEMDVSCEACHGPGSLHVEMSKNRVARWMYPRDPHYGYGLADLKSSAENQIQACAPCHARRGVVAAGFQPGKNYYDHYTETLLTTGIYFADGQVQDEDYIHGSFLQSKMYHRGIRCSDCHDPHSARLKNNGNAVCTSCHMQQHPQAKYDTPSHHFHKVDSAGSQCVACHMPSTTYMEVDPRRDHSFRVPRPDLSVRLGTPNACTSCHLNAQSISQEKRGRLTQYLDWLVAAEGGDREIQAELDRANRWCDEACDRWYGANRKREPHFADALVAARRQEPDAPRKIAELLSRRGAAAPAIARATALVELSRVDPVAAARHVPRQSSDEHPMVRAAAATAAAAIADPGQRLQAVRPLLSDPVRSVRVEAARVALSVGPEAFSLAGGSLQKAAEELEQSLKESADRGGAHVALGILDEQQRRYESAIQHYEDAMRVDPELTGPRTNLAALLESLAESSQGPTLSNTSPTLLQRAKALRDQELVLLARDASLLPDQAELQHRYGLALYLAGDLERATHQLVRATQLAPRQPDYAMALALLYQKRGFLEQALSETERWSRLAPEDPGAREVLSKIRQEMSAGKK